MEQLRRLELWDYATPPTLLEALPRFQHLTSMALALRPGNPHEHAGVMDPSAMHAVLQCQQLRELQLGESCLCNSGFERLPPGSLPQLTRLECWPILYTGPVPPLPLCQLPALQVLIVDG
jgi:hypothetical protein